MRSFQRLTGGYLLLEAVYLACYVLVPLAVDFPHYRAWLTFALVLGALVALTSLGVIALLALRHRRWGAVPFGACALAIGAGGAFAVWGWAEEYAAGDALPIINIGILLVPLGVLLGALLWAGETLMHFADRRRAHQQG